MKKRFLFLLSAGLLLCAVLTAAWLLVPGGVDQSRAALAEYDLQKMTCGSCVANIENALADVRGVGDVQVDLTRETGRVQFDPAVTDAEAIARTISAAGYPATLRTQMSAEELAAMRNEESRLAQKYMARIGDRYVTRLEFEERIDQAIDQNAPGSPQAVSAAWRQIWNEMLQRELLLAAAAENDVLVQPGEVDARLRQITDRHPGLEDRIIAEYGSRENFRKRLREDMIIQRNLDEHVVAGVSAPGKRQSLLQSWYADLNRSTEVKIFDPRLKALSTAATGGCGGSCCG
ncbi:MAG TPA: cation transporter [Desulfuromonadales bacterium]|nr:cation transporter [Desulfuromonadales bacterium]